jgi:hypothetical protein
VSKDGSCLRPLGYRDRPIDKKRVVHVSYTRKTNILNYYVDFMFSECINLQCVPLNFDPKNVGIISQPKYSAKHKINNARNLFHAEHLTVKAGDEIVHLGFPGILVHNVSYFERCDGESPV